MADWKVSKEVVEVKEHPNADKLDVLKVGEYQMVSGKGNYKTGDIVVIIPEKSILPAGPLYNEYEKYLSGSNKDRVKAIRLRGEFSEAVTWPVERLPEIVQVSDPNEALSSLEAVMDAAVGEDISNELGIVKYEAPVPYNMRGEVEPYPGRARFHDVYQLASYRDELDQVIVTEKIHGSQLNYIVDSDGTEHVSSKGLLKKGLQIKESEKNVYWQAVRNSDLKSVVEAVAKIRPHNYIQLIGEVVPVQKGYTYGFTQASALLFEVVVDGNSVPFASLPEEALKLWVPLFYVGPVSAADLDGFAKGKERVSGQELHIREGVVVKSTFDAKAEDGKRLILKVINPKYKDEDSFN